MLRPSSFIIPLLLICELGLKSRHLTIFLPTRMRLCCETKLNSLTKASNMNHYFTFALRQPKKIYFDCKMWPLLFYRTEHLSKSQGGFTRLQFQKSLHKVSFVSTSPLQHLTNDKKDIILLSVSDVHTCMCRHG